MHWVPMSIRSFFLAALIPLLASAQPVVLGVLNAASYNAAIAPGSLVSIFGANFAATSVSAPADSAPTSLAGVSVKFGDVSAPLLFVSPNQLDAVIPFGVSGTLVVTSSAGSTTYNPRLSRNAPGIFTQAGAVSLLDSRLNPIDSIRPQDVIVFYATGLGPVDNSGQVLDPFDVYLGERKAKVMVASLAAGVLASTNSR